MTKTPPPAFYRKNGTLTTYGLACGYVEKKRIACIRPGDMLPVLMEITLYRESNCYHVRVFNVTQSHPEAWKTFDTIKEAREEYNEQPRATRVRRKALTAKLNYTIKG